MPEPMTAEQTVALTIAINKVFNPSAPVDETALFAGRSQQISQLLNTISQRGQHAIIYGERGVGKTSIANILTPWLESIGETVLAPRINAGSSDSYSGLWRKVLSEVQVSHSKREAGFVAGVKQQVASLVDQMPKTVTPDDVRRALKGLGSTGVLLIMIIDEFDQIQDERIRKSFSDTIKTMSDNSVPVTIVLVGVANNVDELLLEHRSVERALVQIHLPRMAPDELGGNSQQGDGAFDGNGNRPGGSELHYIPVAGIAFLYPHARPALRKICHPTRVVEN